MIEAIDAVLAAQPEVLEKIREGKVQAAGAVIGAVMKSMGGRASFPATGGPRMSISRALRSYTNPNGLSRPWGWRSNACPTLCGPTCVALADPSVVGDAPLEATHESMAWLRFQQPDWSSYKPKPS